jgi:protein-disulfide isomerase
LLFVFTLVVITIFISACTTGSGWPAGEADLEATVVAMVDARLTEVASPADASTQAGAETPEPGQADAASNDHAATMLITPTPDRSGELMAVILENTHIFKGDPDAPVAIVEFSDFQ